MTKKYVDILIATSLIIFNINFSFSQDFEGIIKYDVSYIAKKDYVSVDFLEKEMGTKTITYIKNGFYKELTNSRVMGFLRYCHKEDKIYFSDYEGSDTIKYFSCILDEKGKFEYEIFEKTDTILGEICDKLVVKDNYGTKTYYYSSQYSLNPAFYKNYTLSNKYEILKLMKSIYLKLEMEYEPYIVSIEATEIERKKLKRKILKLPKHKVLLKK